MDERLKQVFCDVFGLAPEQVRPDLRAEDVENWDSVTHLTLLLAIEQTFGVTIDPQQAAELTSVGAVQAAVERLRAAQARRASGESGPPG